MLRISRTSTGYDLQEETSSGARTMRLPFEAMSDIKAFASKHDIVFEDCDYDSNTNVAPLHIENSYDMAMYDAVRDLRTEKHDDYEVAATITCKHLRSSDMNRVFRSTNNERPVFCGKKDMPNVQHIAGGIVHQGACADISVTVPKTEKGRIMVDAVRKAANLSKSAIRIGATVDDVQDAFVSHLATLTNQSVEATNRRVPFSVINRIGGQRFVNAGSGLLLPGHIVSFGPNYKTDDDYVLERSPYKVTFESPQDLTSGEFESLQNQVTAS